MVKERLDAKYVNQLQVYKYNAKDSYRMLQTNMECGSYVIMFNAKCEWERNCVLLKTISVLLKTSTANGIPQIKNIQTDEELVHILNAKTITNIYYILCLIWHVLSVLCNVFCCFEF